MKIIEIMKSMNLIQKLMKINFDQFVLNESGSSYSNSIVPKVKTSKNTVFYPDDPTAFVDSAYSYRIH